MNAAELTGRLERLERDNRRLKAAVMAALLLPAVLLLMADAQGSRTVTANRFVLADAKGREEASLGPGPNGVVALRIYDAEGDATVILDGGSKSEDAGLVFPHAGGLPRVTLDGGGKFGGGSLRMEGGEGYQEVLLEGGGKFGGPWLEMYGAMGSRVVQLGSGTKLHGGTGGPELELADSLGNYTAVLGVTSLITPTTGETRTTSAASLVLFGKDHKVIWEAPLQ